MGDPEVLANAVTPKPPSVPSESKGPTERELEAWYNALNYIVTHWGHGSDDLADEVADVRDAIYRYLR
jgi:hypothetical protein